MKNNILVLLILTGIISSEVYSQSQYVKRDYLPGTKRIVFSKPNLVSLIKSDASTISTNLTSVNTIAERRLSPKTDVWILSTNNTGGVISSTRYGKENVKEEASTIVRCPNGDIIVAAMSYIAPTPAYNGVTSCWIFRKGIINWSYRYYFRRQDEYPTVAGGDTTYFRPYCMKKTNEATENYIVAAGSEYYETPIRTNNQSYLFLFKITGSGDLVWNNECRDYFGRTLSYFWRPTSMIINVDTIIVAGSFKRLETTAPELNEIFFIGINQATGAINKRYKSIPIADGSTVNPIINFGYDNEYVVTYQTISAIDGVTAGRITFARLDNNFNLMADPIIFWNNSVLNAYSHSIYKKKRPAEGFVIGGGITYNTAAPASRSISNPLIIDISKTGIPNPIKCQHFWTNRDYISTFMMEDEYLRISPFRYVFHNYKVSSTEFSMSLIHGATKPISPPCNSKLNLNYRSVPALLSDRGPALSVDFRIPEIVFQKEPYEYSSNAVETTVADCR